MSDCEKCRHAIWDYEGEDKHRDYFVADCEKDCKVYTDFCEEYEEKEFLG